ncbi:MAG: hypothetical protein ACREQW_19285 [Candidatus Binatia bacterium]
MLTRVTILLAAFCLAIMFSSPLCAQNRDLRDEAAVAIGVTIGNLFFVPLKAIAAASGAVSGAFSFVLWGGDAEVTQQAWQDTLSGPYMITPDLARAGIGSRPELEQD